MQDPGGDYRRGSGYGQEVEMWENTLSEHIDYLAVLKHLIFSIQYNHANCKVCHTNNNTLV